MGAYWKWKEVLLEAITNTLSANTLQLHEQYKTKKHTNPENKMQQKNTTYPATEHCRS